MILPMSLSALGPKGRHQHAHCPLDPSLLYVFWIALQPGGWALTLCIALSVSPEDVCFTRHRPDRSGFPSAVRGMPGVNPAIAPEAGKDQVPERTITEPAMFRNSFPVTGLPDWMGAFARRPISRNYSCLR